MVEAKVVLRDDVYEQIARSCGELGVPFEECAGKMLELVWSGNVCEVCILLEALFRPDKLKKLVCR